MRLLRRVPNALSLAHLVMSAALFAIPFGSPLFLGLYLSCALSDALDGFLARRLDAVTPLGARLDSAGDFVFFAMYVFVAVRWWGTFASAPGEPAATGSIGRVGMVAVIAIALVALVRFASLAVVWKRTGVPGFIHTYANKAAGFFLYALLPVLALSGASRPSAGLSPVSVAAVAVALSACLLSAIEELLVAALTSPVDLDRKSLFTRERSLVSDRAPAPDRASGRSRARARARREPLP